MRSLVLWAMLCGSCFGQLTFQAVDAGITPAIETWKSQLGASPWFWGATAIDYDSDGDSDIIVTLHGASPTGVSDSLLFRNEFVPSGTLSFTNVTDAVFGSNAKTFNENKPHVWDVNLDGKWDLVCGSRGKTFLNQGNGTFLTNNQTINGRERGIIVKDLNADGVKDFRTIDTNNCYSFGKEQKSILNPSTGIFTTTLQTIALPSHTPQSVQDRFAATVALNNTTTQYNRYHTVDFLETDINNDNRQDMLVWFDGSYTGDVWLTLSLRDANDLLVQTLSSGLPSNGCSIISLQDADGNGLKDLLICGGGITKSGLWLQSPTGTFSNAGNADIADFLKTMPAYVPHEVWEDFDKDGDIDLAVSTLRSGAARVWENTGNGVFVRRLNATHWDADGMFVRSRAGYACDFNADGLTDVLTIGTPTQSSTGPAICWLNKSEPINPPPPPPPGINRFFLNGVEKPTLTITVNGTSIVPPPPPTGEQVIGVNE